jgi:hypothetical protein
MPEHERLSADEKNRNRIITPGYYDRACPDSATVLLEYSPDIKAQRIGHQS